ncbi:MAG: hypothetical protein WA914_10720 [Candidatus Macondimonas sp.]
MMRKPMICSSLDRFYTSNLLERIGLQISLLLKTGEASMLASPAFGYWPNAGLGASDAAFFSRRLRDGLQPVRSMVARRSAGEQPFALGA